MYILIPNKKNNITALLNSNMEAWILFVGILITHCATCTMVLIHLRFYSKFDKFSDIGIYSHIQIYGQRDIYTYISDIYFVPSSWISIQALNLINSQIWRYTVIYRSMDREMYIHTYQIYILSQALGHLSKHFAYTIQ